MNHWAALALDSASGFAGGWLAERFSAKFAQAKLLLILLGIGLVASACLLLFCAPVTSPIQPAFLWKPLVDETYWFFAAAGSTLLIGVVKRSRRARQNRKGLYKVQPSPQVLELLARGKKIEAIKVYREETGLGLREAKEAVDEVQRNLTPTLSFSKEREPD